MAVVVPLAAAFVTAQRQAQQPTVSPALEAALHCSQLAAVLQTYKTAHRASYRQAVDTTRRTPFWPTDEQAQCPAVGSAHNAPGHQTHVAALSKAVSAAKYSAERSPDHAADRQAHSPALVVAQHAAVRSPF